MRGSPRPGHGALPAGLGEVTQAEAAVGGELYAKVGEDLWPELLAWYEHCSPSLDGRGVPSAESSMRPTRAAGSPSASLSGPGPRTAPYSVAGPRRRRGTSTGMPMSATAVATSPWLMPLTAASMCSSTCKHTYLTPVTTRWPGSCLSWCVRAVVLFP